MGNRKRFTKVISASIGLALATAAAAWACTPQAPLQVLGPNTVEARGKVTVVGSAPAPAEIRWNSGSGPVVGSTGPQASKQFSVDVTIPDVAPGVYYLMLTAKDVGVSRAAIEVVPSETSSGETEAAAQQSSRRAVPQDLWNFEASQDSPVADTAAATSFTTSPAMPLGIGLVVLAAGILLAGSGIALKAKKATAERHGG